MSPLLIHFKFISNNVFVGLGVLAIIISCSGLFLFMDKWDKRVKGEYILIPFYIDLFLFYSLAYTFAVVASPSGDFIQGFAIVLAEKETYVTADLCIVYKNIVSVFIESLYYSISIMTTLGDGTIKPQGIFKLVVASHVAFTFVITVFGIAEYFSNESSKEVKSEFKSLKKLLVEKQLLDSTQCETTIAPRKVTSIKNRIAISIKGLFSGKYV
tara:strand:- start:43 stop:681 length:639 start_codon:yes stop_codon:yes gene_type:complete